MKNEKISANQRVINIIQNAINHGFEFIETGNLEQIRIDAEELLRKESEPIEEQCDVAYCGNNLQVEWPDGYGYIYECSGEIENKKSYKDSWKSPDTVIFHSECFNSEGSYVKLYEFLGETEYNVPNGYYWSKNNCHELVEEEGN